MTTLREAIVAEDWPHALGLALEVWRTHRAPVHADLVDRIDARVPRELVPPRGVQRWWMQRARTYDPVAAGGLLANAAELAPRAGVERKLFDRLELLATWPDDPRTARVLATWFHEANVGWMYAHGAAAPAFFERIAALLVRLRDPRVLATLAVVGAEPRGKTLGLRELQQRLAAHVTETLQAIAEAPVADAAEITRWAPRPAADAAMQDERALWADAADSEDARLVLADYLLERGDRRGEIITLACAGGEANQQRSNELLHQHWERWMGELALVLDRGSCTFAGGVLDIATVGIAGAPAWTYPKAATHRELATISVVRAGWHASVEGFVAFLAALPRLPSRVRLATSMVELLARTRPTWPVRTLELVVAGTAWEAHAMPAIAAAAMPAVEVLEIPIHSELDHGSIATLRALLRAFPRLAHVRVDASGLLPHDVREDLATLAVSDPRVEIDHGRYAP